MPRLVMGHDLSSMSQEEINDLMANMRSKRKNGNGRLGLKHPDAQIFSTNNFPIEGKKHQRFVRGTKYKYEHIKSIFICKREIYKKKTAYGQTPIYLIGFLSDSNQVCFEEFRDYPSTQVKHVASTEAYRVQKFYQMFSKKNIDAETYVSIDMNDIARNEFIFKQVKLMCTFAGCRLKEMWDYQISRALLKKFKVFKTKQIYNNCVSYSKKAINTINMEIYRYLGRIKVCPWITEDKAKFLETVHRYKRHSFVTVELGLFCTVLRKFDAILQKSKKEHREEQNA